MIARGHRVVHGNQSIALHDDGVISSKHSKIFDEPWVSLQNESRSSSKQSVSLDDEDVSLEKHRVVGDQEEKISVEQTLVLAELRVLLTKDRVILADEAVDLGDQEVLSRRLRVGRPREERSLWLVAVCDCVLPSYLVNRTSPILPSSIHVDFWFRRSIFGLHGEPCSGRVAFLRWVVSGTWSGGLYGGAGHPRLRPRARAVSAVTLRGRAFPQRARTTAHAAHAAS